MLKYLNLFITPIFQYILLLIWITSFELKNTHEYDILKELPFESYKEKSVGMQSSSTLIKTLRVLLVSFILNN